MKRIWWLLPLLMLAAGCTRQQPAFVWQVDALPDNLDPQVAQGESNLLALQHLYRGLFRLDGGGKPVKDGCARYTVRNHVYNITICNDNHWQDGIPVTAQDYAYALRRCLDPDMGSPYAEAFSAIIRIEAPALDTLRVTAAPGTDLPRLLALPGAYPCREDFFLHSQGQYGLTRKTTLGNGAFALQGWGTALFTLGRAQGEGAQTIRLVLPDSTLPSSARVVPGGDGPAAVTWVLALNPDSPPLDLPALRQAIAALCYGTELDLPEGSQRAGQLLPPILGKGAPCPPAQDPEPLLWAATGALGVGSIRGLDILTVSELLPQARQLNQQLQAQLGIFCRIQSVPARELPARLACGDYRLALAPLAPENDERAHFIRRCAALCALGADAAEADILQSCCLVPLFSQRLTLQAEKGWQGVEYSPFSGLPDLRNAAWQP